MRLRPVLPACLLVACLAATAPRVGADDWPQWQGPDRTAVSKEKGLLQEWPKGGPKLAWKAANLGGGFSTPSVAGGKVYGMSYRGNDEGVWALEEATGKELWFTRIAAAKAGKANYNSGPRGTPTVDGDRLYALGISGDLACLDAATGKPVWAKSLPKDFGGQMMSGWGYSESPLVDGDRLIVTPGGKNALVALDKKTGDKVWAASVPGGGDGASYASAVAAEIAGERQYVQFLGGGVVGVAAKDGRFLWRFNKTANGTSNAATPIVFGDKVFTSSAYSAAGGLVTIKKTADGLKAEEDYIARGLRNQHGGVVLVDGYLYGASGGNEGGFLVCLELATGKVMWDEKDKPNRTGAPKGSIACADGRLYYRFENGTMVLLQPDPKGYVEKGRFSQPDRSGDAAWPHPVVANGKLYLRDQGVLLCYDVKAP